MRHILGAFFTNWRMRKLEWCLAIYTLSFGVWLLLPGVSFATSGYRGVLSLLSESGWGWVYLGTGILHCIALHINGRRAWTPFARSGTLFLNSQVFLAFSLAFSHQNPWGSGVFTYGAIACFCLIAIVSAAEDCGREIKIWQGRNNGGI